jgi:SAM-dependent methyltransferase
MDVMLANHPSPDTIPTMVGGSGILGGTISAPAEAVAPLDEDLPTVASQAYQLADRLCDRCRNFHALWPYRRLAHMCGAEGGLDIIERHLSRLVASGAKRILIAAAADTNLVATVARASRGHAVDITLLDRCETPVELSRRYAERWSLSLTGGVCDFAILDVSGFDLVYANSVLWYFPPEIQVDVLSRFRKALRPGGHLLHVFNTGGRATGEVLTEYRENYAGWVMDELDRQQIPLPDARETFKQRLDDCARALTTAREGTFGEPDAVDSLLRAAGFLIHGREELELPLAAPLRDVVSKLSKRRFITVAQVPSS